MGAAILLQTLVSVAVAVALWRQRFTDRALGWALRLGMTLTIVGAMTGPLMTRPTAAQLADARAGKPHDDRRRAYGRRSGRRPRRAGDRVEPRARRSARAALHRPARDPGARARRARPAAVAPARGRSRAGSAGRRGSYASLFLLLLWQALRGQSVVAPDATALASIAIWALVTRPRPWLDRASARAGVRATDWIGWPYDRRTAVFDAEPDRDGGVAAADVSAAGALDARSSYRVLVPSLLAVVYVVLVAATFREAKAASRRLRA